MNDELFTITESKPDALTAARSRCERAYFDVCDAEEAAEMDGFECAHVGKLRVEYQAARKALEALETAALKSR